MPLYEYNCHKCGKTFEKMQKFVDKPLSVHEGCGGEVVRLVSAPSLRFKGTGWYVTDYGGNGKSPAHSNGSDHKPESKAGSESKTESKSESSNGASKSGSGSESKSPSAASSQK